LERETHHRTARLPVVIDDIELEHEADFDMKLDTCELYPFERDDVELRTRKRTVSARSSSHVSR
jgi:hypothetical protein